MERPTILQAIIDAMESQHVTMSELSELTGISRQYLYRILDGEQTPSVDILLRIVQALEISIEIS